MNSKDFKILGMSQTEYQKMKYNALAEKLKENKEFVSFSETTEEEKRLIAMDDRIDNYIRGKMSPGEERSFLEDCHKDPELKERAHMIALLVKALKHMDNNDK